ncbi:uncharacterized protein EV420DRAFT_1480952 [Desarmillaria tabescens]|uniref:Integrase core domain-containing protein n=1 Tax=Armillaria tabescens TaxID=1929756 RepID=A0AA39KE12_ARMTA|nr:uncharacterized protein EV420DRAFT_1480952 [Desarmillaria tabescens]KAK0457078.1 hypothetical protein EV420DRAFT_1480952 [Desarmillaria tabescens]
MPNQYLPLVPEELIRPRLEVLWRMEGGMSDIVMCEELQKVFDTSNLSSFKRMRKRMGFLSTRQQRHTIETIAEPMEELRECSSSSCDHCYALTNMVGRETIKKWTHANEPALVARRLRKGIVRKVFYCAGVNDLWCFDQHNKWKYRFGLCLHAGVDLFTGVIKWMKIWWNNLNLILICKYYLDVVEDLGYGLLLTQSDVGNENGNVARAHTFLRQWADPELSNTVQHRWMAEKKNIPSEIVWSVLRATFSFGYEGVLQFGVEEGWYDPKVPLEALVFHYIFIPWLQHELDKYVLKNNTTKKRHNRKVARPNGIPLLIEQAPEQFDAQDYKSISDHPVLELVPESFRRCAEVFMNELGNPEIRQDCVWDIYLGLLGKFREHNIITVDEWDFFVDNNYDEETPEDVNNPLVLEPRRSEEVENSRELSEQSGEEDFEISGEAPRLEMSLEDFLQHMQV